MKREIRYNPPASPTPHTESGRHHGARSKTAKSFLPFDIADRAGWMPFASIRLFHQQKGRQCEQLYTVSDLVPTDNQ